MSAGYKYAIDFGTTNSSLAVLKRNAKGQYIPTILDVNTYDQPFQLLRSVVSYKNEKVFIGNEGFEHVSGSDDNPVRGIKMRLLSDGIDPNFLKINEKDISYSDVMSEILRRLRVEAERHLGSNSAAGVICGVPHGTSEGIKNIYLKALYKAGFFRNYNEAQANTEFVEEPVAVALFYGEQIAHQNKNSLVFDFGGGTLDLAIVRLEPDGTTHKVLAKDVMHSAGEEFTKRLFLDVFFPAYRDKYCNGSNFECLRLFRKMGCGGNVPAAVWDKLERNGIGWKFINELDKAKCALSMQNEVVFSFFEPESQEIDEINFEPITLSRHDFEDAISSTVADIRTAINTLFTKNKSKIGFEKAGIDEVLLAGGSSAIPCIQEMLQELFPNKIYFDTKREGTYFINAMTCIAQGLSIFAKPVDRSLLIDDISSFDYGYWDYNKNRLHVIIEKGTSFSDTYSYDFARNGIPPQSQYCCNIAQTNKNVPYFFVDIYEGNRKIMDLRFDKEHHSGEYTLYFAIDATRGVLEVHVYDIINGKWVKDLTLGERSFAIKQS